MRRFTIDLQGPLHGIEYGGEGRLVLLVHALSGSAVNWVEVGGSLTAYGKVIAPELPGFGRTPPAGRSAAVECQADLLARLIVLASDAPALVIGNSTGATAAMLLADRYPDLVDRLVLVAAPAPVPSVHGITPAWGAAMLLYLVPGLNKALLTLLHRQGTPEQRTEAGMDLIAARADRISRATKRLHARVTAERNRMPWMHDAHLEAYRSVVRQLLPYSRFDRMVRRINAPTLLIHGTKDLGIPLAAAERLASIRPDWAYRPLVDVGHVAMLEVPDLFLELVAEFMASGDSETCAESAIGHRAGLSAVPTLPGPGHETFERPSVGDHVPVHPAALRLEDTPSRLVQFPGAVRIGGDDEKDPTAPGLK